MDIIYQFNEKYVPYAGVSMTSLFINNVDLEEINVHVLGDKLTEKSIGMLTELAEKYNRNIYFPNTDKLLATFKKLGMMPYRGTYSVYLRLFFCELINIRDGRAIYMDADTVVTGKLESLVTMDMSGKTVGMVIESIQDDYKAMIGMKEDTSYFNSGVILFDIKKWIENEYERKLIEHIKNVRNNYIGDQDFINIICQNDIIKLPPQYNFQPIHKRYSNIDYFRTYKEIGYYTSEEISYAQNHVCIYHCYRWLGSFPWNKHSLHPFEPVFDQYLSKSLWHDYEKEDAQIGVFIYFERVAYRILPKIMFLRLFKIAHELTIRKSYRDAGLGKANALS